MRHHQPDDVPGNVRGTVPEGSSEPGERAVKPGAWLFGAGGIALYLVMSHWLTANAADQPWAIAALLGPIWLLCLVAALRKGRGLAVALLGLAALLVGFVVASGGIGDVHRLYLLEHVTIHLGLCASFALTLRGAPERMSLIEGIASRVHGSLTPDMRAYARRVTIAWVVYFLSMAAVSVLVYASASWATWAFYANALTPLCLAALFVGEHVLRYRLHPEFERASLMDTVRAYRRGDAQAPVSSEAGPERSSELRRDERTPA